MKMFMKRASEKAGLSPGTLVYVGEERTERVNIRIIDYDRDTLQEKEVQDIEECLPFRDAPTVTWINIDGLHDIGIIEKVGNHFGIHPLVLEDIVNTGQRPKMEDFDTYIYIVLKMLYDRENEIVEEQVSLILGPNFVFTFQEKEGDIFEPIRERIRNGKYRIRKSKPDYLAYSIIDVVVDNYFVILEKLGEKLEDVEDGLLNNPTGETLQDIHELKRKMLSLRRSVWPLRELISGLERIESTLVQKNTSIYLRDVYDHTIQVIDTIESFRDMLSGMLDTYLSSLSNKMNEVMKVLTVIATIFIPLTFLAGVYGMNFQYMPELKWHWAYPVLWVVMLGVGIIMFIFFRRKKWI